MTGLTFVMGMRSTIGAEPIEAHGVPHPICRPDALSTRMLGRAACRSSGRSLPVPRGGVRTAEDHGRLPVVGSQDCRTGVARRRRAYGAGSMRAGQASPLSDPAGEDAEDRVHHHADDQDHDHQRQQPRGAVRDVRE